MDAAEAAIAHHEDMVAGARGRRYCGDECADVVEHHRPVTERRQRGGRVPAQARRIAEHEIRLLGAVRTTSPPEDVRKVVMNTEQLNIYPKTHRATSGSVVTVSEPGLTMRGRGMEADLAAKRFTLLSQATARYVPTR